MPPTLALMVHAQVRILLLLLWQASGYTAHCLLPVHVSGRLGQWQAPGRSVPAPRRSHMGGTNKRVSDSQFPNSPLIVGGWVWVTMKSAKA